MLKTIAQCSRDSAFFGFFYFFHINLEPNPNPHLNTKPEKWGRWHTRYWMKDSYNKNTEWILPCKEFNVHNTKLEKNETTSRSIDVVVSIDEIRVNRWVKRGRNRTKKLSENEIEDMLQHFMTVYIEKPYLEQWQWIGSFNMNNWMIKNFRNSSYTYA